MWLAHLREPEMIFGCGIDVEERDRFIKFRDFTENSGLLSAIYTENELRNIALYDIPLCLALGFSCKEACFKAFGISWSGGKIDWKDIELLFLDHPEKKNVTISFYGQAKMLIREYAIVEPVIFDYSLTDSFVVFEVLLCHK